MSSTKKILFLLNPISGIGKKKVIPDLIDRHFSGADFDIQVRHTEYRSHGKKLAEEHKDQFDCIVAIGGDGSVNEIGSSLIHSNCALGIIPAGSGNGLARHLKIPLKAEQALLRIKEFNVRTMDTGEVNGQPFLGTAGFGFDAHIARKFDEHHSRGFRSYIQLVLREYRKYQPRVFRMELDGQSWENELVMCSIANSCQYGNGFIISPKSEVDDGTFELVQVKKFNMATAPFVIRRFFNGSIEQSKFFSSSDFRKELKITVSGKSKVDFHLDGEPFTAGPEFDISLIKSSLKVI